MMSNQQTPGMSMSCAPGWDFFPHTEKCYQRVQKFTAISWTEAQTACENTSPAESSSSIIGGLVSVPDATTNAFFLSLSQNNATWIGGLRAANNDWIWSDGTAWNYTAWYWNPRTPEPNGLHLGEKHVVMHVAARRGWCDLPESGSGAVHGYLCQYYIAG